jgi:hypothetical protein
MLFAAIGVSHPTEIVAAPLANYQLGQGFATFGLALPRGAVTGGLQIGSLMTQTDIKTRWSDGSIRFAVLTANIPTSGNYQIASGPLQTGSYAPTWPTVAVSFALGGTTYTADLPRFTGSNSWLDGPLVRESRVIVVPTASSTPHPLLQVVFDIRAYAGSGYRIDICVQNVKDTSLMDKVTYNVAVVANGQTLWSRAGITSYAYTRWRKTLALGLAESSVVPDFGPFYASNVVPRYLSTIDNVTYSTSGAAWDVMGFGNMSASMGAPGGREDISPFPFWQVRYLVRKQDSQRVATMSNGNNSGSWSLHITGTDGVSLIKVTDPGNANYWFDPARRYVPGPGPAAPARADGWLRGVRLGNTNYSDVDATADPEHVPNLTFLPYLVTGDRYYLDQTKLWAAWSILQTYPADPLYPEPLFLPSFNRSRRGSLALLWSGGITREYGWPLRLVEMAAIACPDADSDKSYFSTVVQNNLDALASYVSGATTGGVAQAMGWEGSGFSAVNSAGVVTGKYASIWRLAYTAWAVDYASQQQMWNLGQANEFRDRIIRMQIGFINNLPNLPDENARVPYYPMIARVNNNGATLEFMNSWAQLYADNKTYQFLTPPAPPGWWAFPSPGVTGYYGAEAYMLLTMGGARNVAGASTALNWLMSFRDLDGSTVLSDLNTRAGFAFQNGLGGAQPPIAPSNLRIQ